MSKEERVSAEERKVQRIERIREGFRRHGLDPGIVDKIKGWGLLWPEGEGFHLAIQNEEGRTTSKIYYNFNGYLTYEKKDPDAQVTEYPEAEIYRIPVDEVNYNPPGVSIRVNQSMGKDFVEFKADFGRKGKNLVYFSREGKFLADMSAPIWDKGRYY